MRRSKKNHLIRYVLLAVIAFLLTIWFVKPWGETQEDKQQVSQESFKAEQEKEAEKTDLKTRRP